MITVEVPEGREPERRYVLDVILREWLGLDYLLKTGPRPGVTISCPGADGVIRCPDVLLGAPDREWLSAASLPRLPLASLDLRAWQPALVSIAPGLPVLYGDGSVRRVHGDIHLGIDVFGSCFFLLARYEEMATRDRDAHARFPASASVMGREGLLDRPLANEYVEVLRASIEGLWPSVGTRRRVFRMCPTHDVDIPFLYGFEGPTRALKRGVRDALRTRRPRRLLSPLLDWARVASGKREADPYNTFGYLCAQSEKRGLTSAFNFIAGVTNPEFEGRYRIDHPWIVDIIREVGSRGHVIGLHGSYGSFLDGEALVRERKALMAACAAAGVDAPVDSGRQHFLRMSVPNTLALQEAAGLRFDSTLGFADHVGFRCGACFEYPLFSIPERRALAVRERPLIAMDATVFGEKYMNMRPDARALDLLVRLKERCRAFGGDFVLLWHNLHLYSPEKRHLYESLLDA
jgi:hypothetical protein